MSKILTLFGYETFNLEVNIYAMAEDVSSITDYMHRAEKLNTNFFQPLEFVMELWAGFLTIALAVYLLNCVSKYKKAKLLEKSKKQQKQTEEMSEELMDIDSEKSTYASETDQEVEKANANTMLPNAVKEPEKGQKKVDS